MRHVALITLAALAACTGTSEVMQLGPNRYRVTAEGWGQVGAEQDAVRRANAHCASRGEQAVVQMESSRPYASYQHFAGATVNFACVRG